MSDLRVYRVLADVHHPTNRRKGCARVELILDSNGSEEETVWKAAQALEEMGAEDFGIFTPQRLPELESRTKELVQEWMERARYDARQAP